MLILNAAGRRARRSGSNVIEGPLAIQRTRHIAYWIRIPVSVVMIFSPITITTIAITAKASRADYQLELAQSDVQLLQPRSRLASFLLQRLNSACIKQVIITRER